MRHDSENAIWTSSAVILKETSYPLVSDYVRYRIECVLPVSVFQYPALRGDVHAPRSCESIHEMHALVA